MLNLSKISLFYEPKDFQVHVGAVTPCEKGGKAALYTLP